MKRNLVVFFLLTFLLVTAGTYSQNIPLGSWQDYLSYQNAITVCEGQNTVYCSTLSGVFSFNTADNSIERFNRVTGLSDVNVTTTRFNTFDNTLVIGYFDGNIDIIRNGQITNLPDLMNSSLEGSKAINNVYFQGNIAYLSFGGGILQLDLTQDIVLNTYIIGPGGTALNVNNVVIVSDTLFAATYNGIYKIATNDPNPNYFADWQKVNVFGHDSFPYIAGGGNFFFTDYHPNDVWAHDTVFKYNSGKWSYFKPQEAKDNIYGLEYCVVNGNPCIVKTGAYGVTVYDTIGDTLYDYTWYVWGGMNASDAIIDANNIVWVADQNYGLVKIEPGGNSQSFVPPGPFSNTVFNIAIENNDIRITPGGYSLGGKTPDYLGHIGISTYINNTWYRLLDKPYPNDMLLDLSCIAIDPSNPLHAFVGSFDSGLVEYNNYQFVKLYNPSNSTLENQSSDPGWPNVRVGGVAFDQQGNVWATNSLINSNYLSVLKTDGTWQSFDFSSIIPTQENVTSVLVTSSGAKWIAIPYLGILVYQDNGTFAQPNSTNTVLITDTVGKGALKSSNTFCMVQDLNGAIWVGNDVAMEVFYAPNNVMDGLNDWDCQYVYVTETGYTQYLMQNEIVTSMAVDGANRKWIGTQGGGVFLVSSDGVNQIYNFTTSNSPLLSNNLYCITINQIDGKVLFGTDKGIVAYQGNSTWRRKFLL